MKPHQKILIYAALLLAPLAGLTGDIQALAAKMQSTYQGATSWKAEFTQTTFVELIDREIKKTGEIVLKKPGRVKILYQEKPSRLYLSNGKRLWKYTEGDNQVLVYKKVSEVLSLEALTFLEGLGDLNRDFDLRDPAGTQDGDFMFKDKKLILLELIPRRSESPIQRILLGIDSKNHLVNEMTLYNESGNRTHYVFKKITLNADLADDLFEFSRPKGVKEVHAEF